MLMYTVEHIAKGNITYESSYFTKEEACAALERSYNAFVKHDKLKQFIIGYDITDNREHANIVYVDDTSDIYNVIQIDMEVIY